MKEKTTEQERPSLPKKILYIITKSNFGGAQRYVFELAKRSKQEGYETAVALGGNGVLIEKLQAEGITVFHLDSAQRDISLLKEFKLLWRLLQVVRAFRPTALHLNSPKIGGLGAVAGRIFRVPQIVYTNHGWPFKEDRPEWQLMLIRFFSWLTIFFNKKIIVLSETEKEYVVTWPTARKKIEVLPNGISQFLVKNKEEARALLLEKARHTTHASHIDSIQPVQITQKTFVIGTISELHKNKGLSYALSGIKQFIEHMPEKEILFFIIGEGEKRPELESQIKELGLEKNVVLCGHVDDARTYLKAFDVFLLSSIKEGLPYVILEAGISKIPVISTSVGGIPEVIKNFETGLLIPPKRETEIKNALIYFVEHPDMVSHMQDTLYHTIIKKYNFDAIFKKTAELYFKASKKGF